MGTVETRGRCSFFPQQFGCWGDSRYILARGVYNIGMKRTASKKGKIDVGQELRNLGALFEDNNHKLSAVAEQYSNLDAKVDSIQKTLNSHTEMIGKVSMDVEIVKTDIEFIKGGLRKKVDYEEFVALEKRVAFVESKVRR